MDAPHQSVPMRFEKIMVVGSELPQPLEEMLFATSAKVIFVPNGNKAIERAEHEMFDAAVLVSTGEEMDLAETVFNLRDISDSMQLIILAGQTSMGDSPISKKTLAKVVSSASVMTTRELEKHLNWL